MPQMSTVFQGAFVSLVTLLAISTFVVAACSFAGDAGASAPSASLTNEPGTLGTRATYGTAESTSCSERAREDTFATTETSALLPPTEDKLTSNSARSALLVMLASLSDTYDVAKATRERLATEPMKQVSESVFTCGPWRCDLNARVFVFSIVRHPLVFFSMKGVFTWHRDGGWKASVSAITRN